MARPLRRLREPRDAPKLIPGEYPLKLARRRSGTHRWDGRPSGFSMRASFLKINVVLKIDDTLMLNVADTAIPAVGNRTRLGTFSGMSNAGRLGGYPIHQVYQPDVCAPLRQPSCLLSELLSAC